MKARNLGIGLFEILSSLTYRAVRMKATRRGPLASTGNLGRLSVSKVRNLSKSRIIIRVLTCFLFASVFLLNNLGRTQGTGNAIDALNPGEWLRVANSKLSAVVPTLVPPGSSGPNSVMVAW